VLVTTVVALLHAGLRCLTTPHDDSPCCSRHRKGPSAVFAAGHIAKHSEVGVGGCKKKGQVIPGGGLHMCVGAVVVQRLPCFIRIRCCGAVGLLFGACALYKGPTCRLILYIGCAQQLHVCAVSVLANITAVAS
jgi:hypothetical protein